MDTRLRPCLPHLTAEGYRKAMAEIDKQFSITKELEQGETELPGTYADEKQSKRAAKRL